MCTSTIGKLSIHVTPHVIQMTSQPLLFVLFPFNFAYSKIPQTTSHYGIQKKTAEGKQLNQTNTLLANSFIAETKMSKT